MLPVELFHVIAATSPASYRAMLSLPPFARSLDPGIIADYKILFGHSVTITRYTIEWTYHDVRHRLDGPALEDTDGGMHWFQYGNLHRLDGPAAIWPGSGRFWWQNGKLHRLDGPAAI